MRRQVKHPWRAALLDSRLHSISTQPGLYPKQVANPFALLAGALQRAEAHSAVQVAGLALAASGVGSGSGRALRSEIEGRIGHH
jgi:hypothetical protein